MKCETTFCICVCVCTVHTCMYSVCVRVFVECTRKTLSTIHFGIPLCQVVEVNSR